MKKSIVFLKRYKILFLSVFLFFIGYIIDASFFKLHEIDINTDRFLKVLHFKEINVNNIINTLSKNAEKVDFLENLNKNKILFDHAQLEKKGYSFLIFKNDSLKFWTDNSYDLKNNFSETDLNRKLCLLSNGWYISSYVKKGNITIVGLFLVQYHYNYKNKFLKQDFHPDFEMSNTIRVSISTHYIGGDIYDKDNNYLLTLVPSNVMVTQNPNTNILALIYLMAIVLLLKFLQKVIVRHNWDLLIVYGLLIGIRILMMIFKSPHTLYNLSYFYPEYFAESFWFPSLGDLFLNALLGLFIINNLYIPNLKIQNVLMKPFLKFSLIFVYLISVFLMVGVLFLAIKHLITSLIINSNISFQAYKILDLSKYSLVGFVIIAFLFGSMYLLLDKLINAGKNLLTKKTVYIIILISSIYIIYLLYFCLLIKNEYLIFVVIFINIFLFLFITFEEKKVMRYIILISITSLYCSFLITETVGLKENSKKKVLVNKLVTERDQIGEYLLGKMDIKIKKDTSLENLVIENKLGFLDKKNAIVNYLKSKYFNGYWAKYLLEIDICGPRHEYQKGRNYGKCADYYIETERKSNLKIRDYDYYYVENKDGSYSYIGFRNYKILSDSVSITLFIKLNSRLAEEDLGYPELLLETKEDYQNIWANYSYAKYSGNNLITKYGDYSYGYDRKIFGNYNQTYSSIIINNYEHLIYNVDKENTIILSSPITSFKDIIVVFAYLFLFFNIVLFGVRLFQLESYRFKKIHLNFNTKLFIATNSVMFFSFLLVGGGTVMYNISQYKENHQKTMKERVQTGLKNLEQEFASNPNIFKLNRQQLEETMSRRLVNLSQALYADLNLFDLDGRLIASSRPEIYDRGFVGKRINALAYEQLVLNKQAMFFQEESVGKLEYSSAYVPFRSADNQTLAYLHLPYFAKPELLKRNISTLVVAIGNLYAILFILSLILAAFISNSITQPLVMLKRKFTQIELGKKNEPILYESQDEIGSLVKEYNRMVDELKKNIDLMARNEREAAWKEMAKSVAHEIKNPLFPMRLNTQQLQKMWKNKDERFGASFVETSKMFIEQIDILTNIATSFSTYAKMPTPNNSVFNIITEIINSVNLFKVNDENILVVLEQNNVGDEILVYADQDQITRVLVNLIKNSTQAMPPNKLDGFIKVILSKNKDMFVVEIKDNGTGISEEAKSKLFTPSFTTKSFGSGLGLAMSREIVNSCNGTITFETIFDEGTSFFVELPIYSA